MRRIIRTPRLFGGTGDAPGPAEIAIEGERIAVVHRGLGTVARDGEPVLDLPGGTLLPGLIDAHVHLMGSGEPGDTAFGVGDLLNAIPAVTLNCLRNAMRDLESGFTTVRDAACRHYADIALRDATARGDVVGPRIWACGLGITSTAGHMNREKLLPPHLTLPGPSAVADGPEEAHKAVRLDLRYDVDFIKFNATRTEHVRRYQGYCAPEMTAATMAALIAEAHWHGRTVTAHCYGGAGADWALDAGIDGIEHGFYLSDTQLDRMAKQGTALCPTLSVVGKFREHGQHALPPGVPHLEAWRQKAIANAWRTVGRARELGGFHSFPRIGPPEHRADFLTRARVVPDSSGRANTMTKRVPPPSSRIARWRCVSVYCDGQRTGGASILARSVRARWVDGRTAHRCIAQRD